MNQKWLAWLTESTEVRFVFQGTPKYLQVPVIGCQDCLMLGVSKTIEANGNPYSDFSGFWMRLTSTSWLRSIEIKSLISSCQMSCWCLCSGLVDSCSHHKTPVLSLASSAKAKNWMDINIPIISLSKSGMSPTGRKVCTVFIQVVCILWIKEPSASRPANLVPFTRIIFIYNKFFVYLITSALFLMHIHK